MDGAFRGSGDIGKMIGGFLLLVAGVAIGLAGIGAVAAYFAYGAVVAAGSGTGLGILAGIGAFVGAPVATCAVFGGLAKINKDHQRKKRQAQYAQQAKYNPIPTPKPVAPAPAPAPAPATPGDGTPPVFVDALKQLEAMKPEDRKKYLETLRDHFPSEVETLHKYDEQMALKQEAKVMKPITLGHKAPSQ